MIGGSKLKNSTTNNLLVLEFLRNFFFKSGTSVGIFDFGKSWAKNHCRFVLRVAHPAPRCDAPFVDYSTKIIRIHSDVS